MIYTNINGGSFSSSLNLCFFFVVFITSEPLPYLYIDFMLLNKIQFLLPFTRLLCMLFSFYHHLYVKFI